MATLLPGLSTTMVKELDKVGDVKKKRSLANKYKEVVTFCELCPRKISKKTSFQFSVLMEIAFRVGLSL